MLGETMSQPTFNFLLSRSTLTIRLNIIFCFQKTMSTRIAFENDEERFHFLYLHSWAVTVAHVLLLIYMIYLKSLCEPPIVN